MIMKAPQRLFGNQVVTEKQLFVRDEVLFFPEGCWATQER
jgi:hypothetical protein